MRECNKRYLWGLAMFVFGAAGMAEHITSNRGSFPISAVVFGAGFVLICWSYIR